MNNGLTIIPKKEYATKKRGDNTGGIKGALNPILWPKSIKIKKK